jgi:hypothetical protein
MTDKKEPMTVTFAPGCFDHFEGTQEELESLMKEIQETMSKMTPEELEFQSRPVDITRLLEDEDITDDEFEALLGAMVGDSDRKLH